MSSPTPARECGSCSLCCKVVGVEELGKPEGTWCQHCKPGFHGCTIYKDRPQGCRDFTCAWLESVNIPDFMAPILSHVVIMGNLEGDGIVALVDPARQEAWKRKDVFNFLHQCIAFGTVLVVAGKNVYQLLPHVIRKLDEDDIKRDGLYTTYRLLKAA